MARFQKGVSGNPGGRPKIKVDMRERVRVHAGAAIDTAPSTWHLQIDDTCDGLSDAPRQA